VLPPTLVKERRLHELPALTNFKIDTAFPSFVKHRADKLLPKCANCITLRFPPTLAVPSTDIVELSRTNALAEKDEPRLAKLRTERAEPKRAKLRVDTLDPIFANDKTDNVDDNRVCVPDTDKPDPHRKKFRTETLDPMDEASKTLNLAPIRAKARIENEDPRCAN
jgi:hypothetical protein